MAHTKLICILLVLTACNTILFTDGRQLKARGEVEQKSLLDHSHAYDHTAPQTYHGPIIDHSVTGGKKQTPKTKTFDSVAVGEDDFRPTTPGNSPEVGHSYPEKMGDGRANKKTEGTGVSHSMAGNADDFRPTMPGHSPGVGHSIRPNAEQNP